MIELKNKPKDKELEEYILALEDPTAKKLVDIGNQIFPNSEKISLQNRLGEKIKKEQITLTLTSLKEKYKNVFTLDEIKEEMLKFNLDFKSTRNYTGDYNYDYISKIKEFLDANNTTIPINDLKYHFYVLTSELTKKNPLIFYKHKERDGEVYFVMIDGDKNYVNPINWFLGYMEYSSWTSRFSWLIIITFISGLLLTLVPFFTGTFIGLYITFAICLLTLLFIIFDYSHLKDYYKTGDGCEYNLVTIKRLEIK